MIILWFVFLLRKKKTYLLMRKKFQKLSFPTNGLLLNIFITVLCNFCSKKVKYDSRASLAKPIFRAKLNVQIAPEGIVRRDATSVGNLENQLHS